MHAEAVHEERGTVVYLVPGLSAVQRRAALRRLRQEGSRDCGPRLPARELAVALTADRILVGLRHTLAAVRLHPASIIASTALAGGLLAAFVFASVSVRVDPAPDRAAQATALSADAAGAGGTTAKASTSALATVGRHRVVARRPAPGQSVPGQSVPGQSAPGQSVPGKAAPSPVCVTPVGGCPRP